MTTIIQNPTQSPNSGGSNFLIGAIVLIVFVILLLYFGIPILQRLGPLQMDVKTPTIVVPDKVDVNIQQTK